MSLGIVAEHLAVAIHNSRLARAVAAARSAGGAPAAGARAARQRDADRLLDQPHGAVAERAPGAGIRADGERRAARIGELSQMAFEEMRALLRELMPAKRLSTPRAARRRCTCSPARLLEQHGLATAVTRLLPVMVPGNLVAAPGFRRLCAAGGDRNERALFRVCQEAVSNVIRHAEAERVKVSVRVERNACTCASPTTVAASRKTRHGGSASPAWNDGWWSLAERCGCGRGGRMARSCTPRYPGWMGRRRGSVSPRCPAPRSTTRFPGNAP